MVACAYLSLPLSLEAAARVLHTDEQKMVEGKSLINFFSKPNKHSRRNLPSDDPEKWELFKEYSKQDVATEMAIMDRLKKHPMPESEWRNFTLNERINDRGIRIDLRLVDNALVFDG
jgi:DNA polymerase